MDLKKVLCFVFFFFVLFSTQASPLPAKEAWGQLYKDCGLQNLLSFDAFEKACDGVVKYHPAKQIIAICDFSKPSSQNRFFVVDLEKHKLLYQSLVAHGKNSGELMATAFSNEPSSLMSSKGFFKIGSIIQSPKHGLAVLLEGLEKGINDKARFREIIMHGADYVSEQFIKLHGRLGRSFGCPALPDSIMKAVAPLLSDGALLFIYTK